METSTKEITARVCRKKVKEFIPIGEYLRAEGKDDREIFKTFLKYVNLGVTGRYKKEPSENIMPILRRVLSNEPTFDDHVVDIFERRLFHRIQDRKVSEYRCQYKIGDYYVQYLIDGWLVVEIDSPDDRHKIQHLRSLGYRFLNIPKWILEISVDAAIDEILERL